MNTALWVVTALLAAVFLASGATVLLRPREVLVETGYAWAADFSPGQVRLIGLSKVLGAAGLILPAALGVLAVLTPTAAAALATLMAGAVIVHLRRDEAKVAALPATLGVATALVAVLRFGPYAF